MFKFSTLAFSFVLLCLQGLNAQIKSHSFSLLGAKGHASETHNVVGKRSLSDDRPQLIVHQNYEQDSGKWRTFRDTTHTTYYTNGMVSSERNVFPSDWGTYENYNEYQYDGAGRLIKEVYFSIDPNTSKYDTSSITEYKYERDILIERTYSWRSPGTTTWEDWNQSRYDYLLQSGTDMVSSVVTESRSKDDLNWSKEQRIFIEYGADSKPKKLTLEIWDQDESRFIEGAVYDTISWRTWVKNDHQVEKGEFNMVEGSVMFLGGGRMRLRRTYDSKGNNTAEYTYFINTTDSVLSEGTKYEYTYDSEGRTLSRNETNWSEDSMRYLPYQINYYYDYYAPTALSCEKLNVTATLFPNPATDVITFIFSGETTSQLQLIDMVKGQIVHAQTITSAEPVSIESLPSGTYIYTIQNGQNKFQGTLLKQ